MTSSFSGASSESRPPSSRPAACLSFPSHTLVQDDEAQSFPRPESFSFPNLFPRSFNGTLSDGPFLTESRFLEEIKIHRSEESKELGKTDMRPAKWS